MPVGTTGRNATSRRALEEPELEQVRLDDVLDRVALLPHGRRQRREPDGTTAELDDQRGQDREVELVQALLVNLAKDMAAKGEITLTKNRADDELVY